MVGMGDLDGARPLYGREYLCADPAILPGAMPIGTNYRGNPRDWLAVKRHGVYEATAAVYADGDLTKPPLYTAPVALGTVAENLPAATGSQGLVVTASIDVPATGNYYVHAGFGDSSHNGVTLNGQEVYRKGIDGKPTLSKVALEAGQRYPVRIAYLKSGSAAFWLERVDIPGRGDLVTVTRKDGKFQYLLDEAGHWTVRQDVTYIDPRLFPSRRSSPLSATSNNGKTIGPELGFGWVLGEFHDEQVLVIKAAMGNRSLNWDFRPPSSGSSGQPGADTWEGLEYRLMVKAVRDTLAKIHEVVPGYAGQGYEIVGFGWFQGHKDKDSTREEYERHLVNLIHDLRNEFQVPQMRVVVATVGFHGYRVTLGPWQGVWAAQMAVGDPKQHPEFAGTVAAVDTRDFWREAEESPCNQDYHYNRNAETYLLVGEAMGRAMVRLLGGAAEEIPKSDREARTAAALTAEAARPEVTEEQKLAHALAVRPLVLDGLLAAFFADPRNRAAVEAARRGPPPAKPSPLLKDAIDEVVEYYQAAGIHDYDWRPFGEDLRNAEWHYFGFDLPGRPGLVNVSAASTVAEGADDDAGAVPPPGARRPAAVAVPSRIEWPAGMERWFAPDFDAAGAGWKTGRAPFGQSAADLVVPDWAQRRVAARAPQTPCENDVLLLRREVELPPPREDCRYRIRIHGSAHNNMGEGYAMYLDGKPLCEFRSGILAWRREGGLPRGAMLPPEFRALLQDGRATLAVCNFPMDNWSPERYVPPGAALSVWIEEQRLPPKLD